MHQSLAALTDRLDWIRQAPADLGTVRLLVCRPAEGDRQLLTEAQIDLEDGLVGDNWRTRGSTSTTDGAPDPRAQVTLTGWRTMSAIAGSDDRCALAGDQLYVDLDLSVESLPVGTRLTVGSAVLMVTDKPHRGCDKFSKRFGRDALRFVNRGVARELRLRGVNTSVVQAGVVRVGDAVHVVRAAASTCGDAAK